LGDPGAIAACDNADNYFDSILALDLDTGAIKWHVQTEPFDAWNEACLLPATANCPSPAGPDYDFGEGAALYKVQIGGGKPYDLVGAGAQSGQYWTVDADTGNIVWTTMTGPGSRQGGLTGGSAVDGERIYAGNANAGRESWILIGGQTVDYGFWNALDARTGEILWQTADPITGSLNEGAVTAANGVVYACSLDATGHMYAFDAATGAVLWSFASSAPCRSGPAVVDGRVYWGAGSNSMYAFQLP
jgi:polyvinyl alcohol dehydrogenase (cytochrome)